jgi:hypothetical protein
MGIEERMVAMPNNTSSNHATERNRKNQEMAMKKMLARNNTRVA